MDNQAPTYSSGYTRSEHLEEIPVYTPSSNIFLKQVVPITLALILFILLSLGLRDLLTWVNNANGFNLDLSLHISSIIFGAVIYFKTSVDFGIFIGRLMHLYPGWKNRIAIELGTAIGNGLGTISVLLIWLFIAQIDFLLAVMITFASLVLLELAFAGIEHFVHWEGEDTIRHLLYKLVEGPLSLVNKIQGSILRRVLPGLGEIFHGLEDEETGEKLPVSWGKLLMFSLTIPVLLGADDFAGYVPVFSYVTIYGFAVGIFGAHALLNMALFISPRHTIALVKNSVIAYVGTLAFILLAVFGFVEAARILLY